MNPTLLALAWEEIVKTYGRIRASTDEFIVVRGARIENHFPNRRAISRLIGMHKSEVERFLRMCDRDPGSSPYYRGVCAIHVRSDHTDVMEFPELPSPDELRESA